MLIKQVDENWFEGQVGGCQGYLPANYVEVNIGNPAPTTDDQVLKSPPHHHHTHTNPDTPILG